jgi:hypothetical protein
MSSKCELQTYKMAGGKDVLLHDKKKKKLAAVH